MIPKILGSFIFAAASALSLAQEPFRPPAVPLVTSDPYLSIWSEADRLTDDSTRHWTHHVHPLVSMIRIDGQTYRLMGGAVEAGGNGTGNTGSKIPALPQAGLMVTPTRTLYRFGNEKVKVDLTFMTPVLPDDLDVLSRPVTYLTWKVQSADRQPHIASLFISASSAIAVENQDQEVDWKRESAGPLTTLRTGTVAQSYLRPEGDDTRIDWGYAYLAASTNETTAAIGSAADLQSQFASQGALDGKVDTRMPRKANDAQPVLAFAFSLGSVGDRTVERRAMIAYDEIYSIEYFGTKLRPYWRRNGMGAGQLLQEANKDYDRLAERCAVFDEELTRDAEKVGGAKYAQILALAYRECLAACGLAADANKQPLLFTKENTSNGDIATVDVIFPMDPIFILLSPTLAKASLVSNFDYAGSPHWKFPNAPHDLGTYPRVFGRDDGGEGMPVEESGNMIILTDAIAHDDGNADFASRYWPQLTQWAHYLEQYGLDPEDQLCTDDFMGHLAHNANLSVKAILALAAYGDLCKMRGEEAEAKKYTDEARTDARHWIQVADEGDHSLLAFDKPNTWSQKYNLVWDKILGLDVFPPSVAQKEVAYYKQKLLPFGFPLDSRTVLTKTDWSIWSATMATSQEDFETLVDPIWRYLNETTSRDPIADSYITNDVHSDGMHARPVVGGFFIRMLSDRAIWRKWASRDHAKAGNWAPLPKTPLPPVVEEVVPTARTGHAVWHYTTEKPAEGWVTSGFDDSKWKSGEAGLGTDGTPGIVVRTTWNADDIWIRRAIVLPNVSPAKLKLLVYHDEDVEVYIDGVLAASEPGFVTNYSVLEISAAAKKHLKAGGQITVAAHCHQTTGGQGIDIGFGTVQPAQVRTN